jgi:ATP phosphoribosyltransferase
MKRIQVVQKLGFSKCSVVVPKNIRIQFYQRFRWFAYRYFLSKHCNWVFQFIWVNVDIHQISGSVEIAPNIGLADAIVDISSGSTLFKNNLKEVEII